MFKQAAFLTEHHNLLNYPFILFSLFLLLSANAILPEIVSSAHRPKGIQPGAGSIVFRDQLGMPEKPIRVWYYQPEAYLTNSPILFVMHGMSRRGKKYRNVWTNYSKKYNALLLVPEFSKTRYRGSRRYNLGHMFTRKGKPRKESRWTFSLIEHLFDYVKELKQNTSKQYYIYGHSAGAQFVHRLILFKPRARIEKAVAANAGWYTMPTFKTKYPYGLKKSGMGKNHLETIFEKKLIILLGTKDTNKNHKSLNKSPGALKQGKHRFERGETFYNSAKKEAARWGTNFNWILETVPGAGHSNAKMAEKAANLLFE